MYILRLDRLAEISRAHGLYYASRPQCGSTPGLPCGIGCPDRRNRRSFTDVALKPGFEASVELRKELLGAARKRLGPAVAPRDIEFRDNLPKTRSGKIMLRLLKARELG